VLVPTTIIQQYLDDPDPIIWRFRDVRLNADDPHDYSPPEGMPPRPDPVYVLASEQPEDGADGKADEKAENAPAADDQP
jgi:hypothetical protein